MTKEQQRDELLAKIEAEEETENNLIWLYDTLLNLGIENCLPNSFKEEVRSKIKLLADESRKHNLMLENIKAKYQYGK